MPTRATGLVSAPMRRALSSIVLVVAILSSTPLAARADLPEATKKALTESDLIYTATERQDGSRSSAAPIWFWFDGTDVYTTTSPESYKAKRLARGSPLYIWVGEEDGPFLIGEAERIDDPAIVAKMGQAYSDKYWIAWVGFFRPRPDRVREGETIAYRVRVKEGTPHVPVSR